MRAAIAIALALSALPAAAQTLVIGNKGEDSVSFVDLASGRERGRVATAKMPHEVAVSPDGARAAVVAYGGSTIDVFDVATATLIERIDIAPNLRPHGLIWLGDGDRLIATAEGSDSIAIIRVAKDGTGPRVRSIATGQKGSHLLTVSADARRAYVVNMGSASVTTIDLRTMKKLGDIPVGREPEGIALASNRLWIADRRGGMLYAFDAQSMRKLGQVPVGPVPIRVAVTPDGRQAVTSNYGDGTLSVVDARTRRVTRTIKVGDKASEQVTILFSADGTRLYVAQTGTDTVAEIDFASGKLLRRLPAGRQGDGLGIAR